MAQNASLIAGAMTSGKRKSSGGGVASALQRAAQGNKQKPAQPAQMNPPNQQRAMGAGPRRRQTLGGGYTP